jgi:hypothetical protein
MTDASAPRHSLETSLQLSICGRFGRFSAISGEVSSVSAHGGAQRCRACRRLAPIAAMQGEEDRCHEVADETIAAATERGLTAAAAWSRHSLALLDLGLGRYDSDFEPYGFTPWAVGRCSVRVRICSVANGSGGAADRLTLGPRYERRSRRLNARKATPWSDRTRSELQAAGEIVVRRTSVDPFRHLTPQELQVVRLAATGATNREIAGQLSSALVRSATTSTRPGTG